MLPFYIPPENRKKTVFRGYKIGYWSEMGIKKYDQACGKF